ncbi:MAG: DUF547 domain-containing protein [Ignavibacteria bacterium]
MNLKKYINKSLVILLIFSGSTLFAITKNHNTQQSLFDYGVLDAVLKKYVENGMVNYKGISEDNPLKEYFDLVSKFDPNSITDNTARLTFWINAYNAFTIKLITDYYPVKSIMDIEKKAGENPWSISFINIGGEYYSLDEIEKDIIIPEFGECRIHYALVCAALSCPPLRSEAYTPEKLNEQLDEQAKLFLNDKTKNYLNKKGNTMNLSMIYNWYSSDFKECSGSVINHISQYVNEEDSEFIKKRKTKNLNYLKYSWKLNEWKQ